MRILAIALLVFVIASAQPRAEAPPGLATSFEANLGQLQPDVRFFHRSRSFGVEITASGAVRISTAGRTQTLTLVPGAGAPVQVTGNAPLDATASVFVGRDAAGWITGIPLFSGVTVREASPGVDLALSANGTRVVIELRVAPGVDPALLAWEIDGARLAVDRKTIVDLGTVSLRLSPAPFEVSDLAAGFTLDAVIEVVASAPAGSADEPRDVRLALDAGGGVFVAGTVDRGRGVEDAFVARLEPDRESLAWVAYLGGAGSSRLAGITVTPGGEAIVAGFTVAADFPDIRSTGSPGGGFVTHLARDGSSLAFSTLLPYGAEGVALAPDGTAHVVGSGGGDAFVAALDTEHALLVSSTAIDRGGIESGRAIGVDRSGLALVAGASRLGDRSWSFVGDDARMWLPEGDLEGAASSMALDRRGRAWIAGGDHGAWLAAVEPGGSLLPLRSFGEETQKAAGTVAVALGAARAVWLAEQTESGVVVSRWTGRDDDSGSVVARIAAVDRPGAVALADGVVLVAGSTRGGIGDDADALLVAPIAGSASAVLAVLPGEPLAAGCPGSINFDNSAGTGLWQTAANWDLDVLPGAADDVCIDGFGVTLSVGTQTVNSVTVTAPGSLAISGATLSLASASQVDGPFTISGALAGSGSLTVSGLTSWTGGTMSGAGTTNANGGLSIGGTAGKNLVSSRVLNTPGATTLAGTGFLQTISGSVINNTGTWDIQTDADLTGGGAGSAFNNIAPGIFKKSAGTGTSDVEVTFNNASTVEIQTGTLSLDGGGTHSGSFSGSPGTTLEFGGTAANTLQASSVVSANNVVFSGSGLATIDGSYSATSGTSVSTGTKTFNPASTISSVVGSLTISGGTVNFNSGETITPSTLSLSGVGTLAGTDTVTVSGLTSWTGGTMSGAGTTNANGGLSIGGPFFKTLDSSRVLNTPGATTIVGTGSLSTGSGSVINNTGTWDIQTDADLAGGGAGSAFNNSAPGIFKKSAGTGTSDVTGTFNNASTVEIQTGTLSFDGGGTHSGSFSGSPGTTLEFGGTAANALQASSVVSANNVVFSGSGLATIDGSYSATSGTSVSTGTKTFNPASTISSVGGSLTISGGTVNFNSGETITPSTLSLSGVGTLAGTDTVTVSGLTSWTGGTMSGAGTTNANGGLSIGGTAGKDLVSSRVLNTPGATTFAGTGDLSANTDGVINNTGTWDVQTDTSLSGIGAGPAFNNIAPGIFKKSAGTGTIFVDVSFNNAGSVQALAGTTRFLRGYLQTAGSTIVNGGTITTGATLMNIQGGTLGGVGTVTANVTSSGVVGPGLSPGALTIVGNYVQSAAGALHAEVGGLVAGTQYDQLTLGGTGIATLSGTLSVTFVDGFVPTGPAAFTVLGHVARTGTFSTVNLPALAPDLQWRTVYGPTSVVVEILDDTDIDGTVDIFDCAPLDPGAWAIHGEVTGVLFGADGETLSWGLPAPAGGPDVTYDVMRGALDQLPVGGGAAESCLQQGVTGPSAQDDETPASGSGFYYLVRARNVCGAGTYGSATGGAERISSACP